MVSVIGYNFYALLILMGNYMDKKLGKVVPYGVYDIGKNKGWVSVGISSDTAEFAANNATPAAAPNYTVSNLSTDRALDCDSTSDAEVADVLGQVITDLIAIGIFQ